MVSKATTLSSLIKVLCGLVLVSCVCAYPHIPPFIISNKGYDGEEPRSCADALTDTLMTLDDLVNVYLILSTGKYLDNWGAYGSCIDSVEGGAYWMTTITGPPVSGNEDKANLTFFTGLCVPSDCNMTDLRQLDELFVGAAEFNNVTNPYISYFAVTEYVNEQQGMPGVGEAVVIGVILVFMTGIGIGTLLHLTKLCDKPHIKERANRAAAGDNSAEYNEIVNEGSVDPNVVAKEFNNDTAVLYRKKTLAQPFLAFSVLRNAIRLVTPQKNAQLHPQAISEDEGTLQLLNGLRFYAMLWIVYANTLALTEKGVVENIKDKPKMFQHFMFTLFPTAFFASDAFFFMSGFLAIYSMLKLRNYSIILICSQYLRRLYRIIPIIAFVLFTARYVIPRFVEGPLCQRYNLEFADCDRYFWTNLLLINNFYPAHLSSSCMPWTWYFSCDFQLFILVPLIALLFQRSKIIGYATSLVLVAIGLILTAVLNGISSSPGANPYLDQAFFTDIYIKPWTRAVPYFLGVYFGSAFYFYAKDSDENVVYNRIKASPILRAIMYFFGFGLMFTIIFVLFDYTKNYGTGWSHGAKVVYATLSSLVFILGLVLMILPALLNRAKLIRFLLIGPVLTLLGRVTYMVALTHPILMIAIYVTSGQAIYVEAYKMFSIFVGHAFLIYLVSTSLNLLIELPIRGLEAVWHERFFAQNMVENWITAKSFDKVGDQKQKGKEEAKTN